MPLGSTSRFEPADDVWNDVRCYLAADGTLDVHLQQVERDKDNPFREKIVFADGAPKTLEFTIGSDEAMLDLASSLLEAVKKRKEEAARRRYHRRRRKAERNALDDPDDESRTDPRPY